MKEKVLNTMIEIVVFWFIGFLIAWFLVREIDKDVEKECGMHPFENAPEYCESWWQERANKD